MMTFHGVKSPALDIPLIELETPQGDLVDLYNDYHLQSVVLRGDQLTFGFASVTAGTPTDVRFSGVRDLHVLQAKDWVPREAVHQSGAAIREPVAGQSTRGPAANR